MINERWKRSDAECCWRHAKIKECVRLHQIDTQQYLVIIQFSPTDYYHYKWDWMKHSVEVVIRLTELMQNDTTEKKKKRKRTREENGEND